MKDLLTNYFIDRGVDDKIAGMLAELAITLAIIAVCILINFILKKIVIGIASKIAKEKQA